MSDASAPTGASIIGGLLRDSEPLITVVPEAQIKGGRLPEDITLPALLVRTVSSVRRQPLKQGDVVHTKDRVSVTVRASSWREQNAVMKLVTDACAEQRGDIGGALRVSVLPAGIGPDMDGPGGSFEQAQDFRVSFDA